MTREQLMYVQLMEEAAEISQIASKIVRFGASDHHLKNHNVPNYQLLKGELNDLYAILEILRDDFDLDISREEDLIQAKKLKIEKYRQYSIELKQVDKDG